ncbi:hypothetical protein NLI96_g9718 [Meripilus lineatus]|uniref:Uncharacterized protein n=1 Tax=Meripilus lineatus TaxID=2056292 RepID=A0AAD5UUZ1_9APHY|nr:hypothetical protein NLI96_g9718 [Physisporinus lineatus]
MLRSPRRATRLCAVGDALKAPTTQATIPLPDPYVREAPRKITSDEQSFKAYRTLRDQRAAARYEGRRKIREAKKAEEEANKKK